MINLTYVSECRLAAGVATAEIGSILAHASERNAQDGITGVLLVTRSRFVQTLEGATTDVDRLLASIERDPRHAMLAVVDRHEATVRNFHGWSLADAGRSLFVARTVARGLSGFHTSVHCDVARLLKMMVAFGTPPPPRPIP